jgi:hypothetical protein
MSSPASALGAPKPLSLDGERRRHQRHPASAKVELMREGDIRRAHLPAEVVDISISGLGLLARTSFDPEEGVRIRLRNDIRRFAKEVRGVVRWAQLLESGKFRIGIELYSRLTALDIQILKQVGTTGESGKKVWV